MPEQSFKSHTKGDPPFHFFLVPVILATLIFSMKHAWAYSNGITLWLADLTRRALDERLTPKQIMSAIQNWRPDRMRI